MSQSKTSKFKRVLCGILSTLTMLSGTAVAGTAVSTTASAAEAATQASSAEVTPATFSWDNATVYFLLTDRFYNGNTSNDNAYGRQNINVGDQRATFHGGDFAGITQKINEGYFDDLGVNAIWLSAPYEQIHGYIVGGDNYYHYSYHGYYVLDYTETDAAFGTKEEFRTLVDTAHEHGIRIVMDIVMNHAGYNSLLDMSEYGFGTLKSGWDTYYNNPPSSTSSYHSYIDYDSDASAWAKWWGPDWVRCGVAGYTEDNSSEITRALEGLPDFKTGSSAQLGLPEILKTKWAKEGTLAAKQSKYGTSNTVTGYISTWLAEWVREFGVDGFRCDTAKHVEKSAWGQLSAACTAALKEWKANNPTKKLDDLDFWMTGEDWNHGVYKDDYYTTGGFDSMINFDCTGAGVLAQGSVSGKYNDYANAINNDDSFNVLSYISSHDTTLARGDNFYLGSAFLMLPGAVQIYYGDETARPKVSGFDDSYKAGHCLRSDMNWGSYDPELLAHWGKVGNFRKNHIAVGAGANTTLTASSGVAFGRTYSKNGLEDKAAGVIGASANTDVTVDVSAIWSDGTTLENFYDESVAVVSGGSVTFNSGAHGTILIAEPDGNRGRVTVTHIDKDSGKTLKTETLSGLVGESYTASALTLEGFTVSSVVGSKTGTFSETEASVTFYYTFDSKNYAYIVVNHVDSATNAEIADSETKVGKIGTTYTTEAKTIKNYELDTTPSNATGTVKSGTTTVIYKYNYVEPTNLQVHYYNANSWSSVNMYAYTGDGATATKYLGDWPGKAMTSEGNNWFYCDVPDTETGKVIFNCGTAQEPASMQPGYDAAGEVWIKSGKVYPTGKVNVKYVSTDGKVLGSEVLKGMADGTTTYTTSEKSFSGYTLSASPSNASGTFTEATINVTYTYKSNSVEELKNTSALSASSVAKGKTITVNASATGGTAPYTYTYSVKRNSASSWTVKATDTSSTTLTLTPGYVEKYYVKVIAKDSTGKTAATTLSFNVTDVPTELTNKSSLSATTITKGASVTVKGAASGGTAPYKYTYQVRGASASSWTTKATNTTATSLKLTPSTAQKYYVRVIVTDSASKTASLTLVLNVNKPDEELKNTSTLSAASVVKGTTVTINGSATGGSGSYKYSFYVKQKSASSWKLKGTEFGTAKTATITPNAAVPYQVMVQIMDGTGTIVSKTLNLEVTDKKELTNNSTLSATSVNVNTTVTVKAAAAGGTTPYKYTYQVRRASASSWTTKAENTTTTSITLKPTQAETYYVKVIVFDAAGTRVAKTLTLKVSKATTLTNTSTLSASTVTKGTTITIKGSATGGTAPYTYAYYVKQSTASNWTAKGTVYGTATSATITPSQAVQYDVMVNVKDSAGTISTKTFTVTVK